MPRLTRFLAVPCTIALALLAWGPVSAGAPAQVAPATDSVAVTLSRLLAAGAPGGSAFAGFVPVAEEQAPTPPPLTDVPVAAPDGSSTDFPAVPWVRDAVPGLRLHSVDIGRLTCAVATNGCPARVALYARAAGPRLTLLSRRSLSIAPRRDVVLDLRLGPRTRRALEGGTDIPVLAVVRVDGRTDWFAQRLVLRSGA